MSSITSVEMNYLVFRYLQESGFTHSAFTLGYEAGINKSPIDGVMVPPGALVTFVQRGLHYLEMEANITSEETDVDEDFLFLQPLDIITKNVDELKQIIKEKKKNLQREKEKSKDDKEKVRTKDGEKSREKEREKEKEKEIEKEREQERSRLRERTRQERDKELEKSRERKDKDKDRLKQLEDHS